LAGRIADSYLQVFRSYLAASEWKPLKDSLRAYLADRRIPVTAQERRLLGSVLGEDRIKRLPDLAGPPPAYTFTAEGPTPAGAQRWLLATVPKLPSARKLVAAYRRPAEPAAIPLTTWVYPVEFDVGADIARLHSELCLGDPDRGLVEAYATDDRLGRYHADALAVGNTLWIAVGR
jgi:hypothetical protein